MHFGSLIFNNPKSCRLKNVELLSIGLLQFVQLIECKYNEHKIPKIIQTKKPVKICTKIHKTINKMLINIDENILVNLYFF